MSVRYFGYKKDILSSLGNHSLRHADCCTRAHSGRTVVILPVGVERGALTASQRSPYSYDLYDYPRSNRSLTVNGKPFPGYSNSRRSTRGLCLHTRPSFYSSTCITSLCLHSWAGGGRYDLGMMTDRTLSSLSASPKVYAIAEIESLQRPFDSVLSSQPLLVAIGLETELIPSSSVLELRQAAGLLPARSQIGQGPHFSKDCRFL